jgi:hypothetical protein
VLYGLIIITADIVNATMMALEIQPTFFYNVFYSLISSVNQSFTCPYESVQTCSHWKVRLWQGFLIVTFYFFVVAMIVNAVGLSFVSAFLIPEAANGAPEAANGAPEAATVAYVVTVIQIIILLLPRVVVCRTKLLEFA